MRSQWILFEGYRNLFHNIFEHPSLAHLFRLVAVQHLHQSWGSPLFQTKIPDSIVEAEILNPFNSFIMGHLAPKRIFLLRAAWLRAVGFFWVASGLESIILGLFLFDVEVVAPGAIQAKSFDAEVVANFSFILLGNMNFFPDFLIAVRKGALDSPEGTFYRKGQYPFSTRYLHFCIEKKQLLFCIWLWSH